MNSITAFFRRPSGALIRTVIAFFGINFLLEYFAVPNYGEYILQILIVCFVLGVIGNKRSLNRQMRSGAFQAMQESREKYSSDYKESRKQVAADREKRFREADRRAKENWDALDRKKKAQWYALDQQKKAEWDARDAAKRRQDRRAWQRQQDAYYWKNQTR
ncbi:MAG: hypothetical protein Q4B22_08730 [Eubacteriales bacterium]|nr:hypothetical protein [Eubacteriales bacterium]